MFQINLIRKSSNEREPKVHLLSN